MVRVQSRGKAIREREQEAGKQSRFATGSKQQEHKQEWLKQAVIWFSKKTLDYFKDECEFLDLALVE